jgi:hypothetical protein
LTSTAQKVFMRVPVDQATLDPAGYAQFVSGRVAYVTTDGGVTAPPPPGTDVYRAGLSSNPWMSPLLSI